MSTSPPPAIPSVIRRPGRSRSLPGVMLLALVVLAGCGAGDTGTDDARDVGAAGCAEPGQWGDCELPGHDDRGYDVESWLDIDTRRVWVVGHSNGAAMSHRLACELSDRITAIAAVGGTNQFGATAPCEPAAPVAIMQVHGTDDSCWSYEPSDRSCAGLPIGGHKVRVDGGGHTWPGGDTSGPEWLIGETTQDWDSIVLVEFLARFAR